MFKLNTNQEIDINFRDAPEPVFQFRPEPERDRNQIKNPAGIPAGTGTF